MIRKAALIAIANVVLVALAWLLIEGFASTFLVVEELEQSPPMAERVHTTYDPDLGWANLPDLFVPDMYGPGKYVRINAQGFRNNAAVSKAVPPGKIRVICSGDSFTFGYGVDNDHTWCQLLAAHDARLEAVNMGEGGYGVDQAYLWYKRDGAGLAHDVQVLAFVTTDFERMLFDTFLGYGKPVLDLRHGQLVVHNVPVPKPQAYRLWLVRHAVTLEKLGAVKLMAELLSGNAAHGVRTPEEASNWIRPVVAAMFADLQRINASKHSVLVLVLLPTRDDYVGSKAEFWREFLASEATRQGLVFIDAIEALRALPPRQIEPLFIPQGQIGYMASAGHYTEAGNAFVATLLYERLRNMPETEAQFARAQTSP